jgi:3-oxoacyl-[acyl-carrier protein] reductase
MKTSERVAIVTGASRGIGRAVARGLAQDGFGLVVNYRKRGEEARLLAEEIRAWGLPVKTVQADLEMPEAAAILAKAALEGFGRIDVLVNNAGTHLPGIRASEVKAEEWDRVLRVNLTGPFLLIQAVLPAMRARRSGVIVNLSSNVVRRFPALSAPYTASKCGLDALTRVLAREEGANGIRINSVAPGPIETDMLRETLDTLGPEKTEAFIRSVPLQRLGRPEEVAEMVRFLASDRAAYVTGEVFFVNGGGPGG